MTHMLADRVFLELLAREAAAVEFEGPLVYTGLRRGRSAAGFLWTDLNGRRYNMFMKDMEKLVCEGTIDKGVAKGKFTFVKRGQDFGITPVTNAP